MGHEREALEAVSLRNLADKFYNEIFRMVILLHGTQDNIKGGRS